MTHRSEPWLIDQRHDSSDKPVEILQRESYHQLSESSILHITHAFYITYHVTHIHLSLQITCRHSHLHLLAHVYPACCRRVCSSSSSSSGIRLEDSRRIQCTWWIARRFRLPNILRGQQRERERERERERLLSNHTAVWQTVCLLRGWADFWEFHVLYYMCISHYICEMPNTVLNDVALPLSITDLARTLYMSCSVCIHKIDMC